MNFKFSQHALAQMELRKIPKEIIERVLANPEQIREEEGKKVYQSIIDNYLFRIFVNEGVNPKKEITVYKTSKIRKYYET